MGTLQEPVVLTRGQKPPENCGRMPSKNFHVVRLETS